jgi:hypothetical protein
MGAVTETVAEPRRKSRKKRASQPAAARPQMFEVRIEKLSGKRSVDAACWNVLGKDGWELVAVRRKRAYFRRALR